MGCTLYELYCDEHPLCALPKSADSDDIKQYMLHQQGHIDFEKVPEPLREIFAKMFKFTAKERCTASDVLDSLQVYHNVLGVELYSDMVASQ